MKFLEYTPLSRVSAFLQNVNLGDYVVEGEIQAYSCKVAGNDKKLSRSLDQEVVSALACTPPQLSLASPVGPLTDANSRKTLIYLILTLNHMYPDYDFSALRAHHFHKEASLHVVQTNIDSLLLETSKLWGANCVGADTFSEALWLAVDEVITLCDCDVYSYTALMDGDPFADPENLWSFNYFFYNKKSKRVVYFCCRSRNKSREEISSDSENDDCERNSNNDWNDTFMDDMDI
mmetsp:Transcript_9764/g.13254  ORF Transcript_9764/g.13254 Transcript_9764/m.13254 type:complete len:234 (-) Transcript_9764:111-812(-)|eukprot:CAMPEP_0196575164 /NCGR_PEP_ID=MMETSP1081-20130531/4696_1 /TAXON_ID=36882 /ORGANISM="Pyramimonas amylifera, Strain CCMP720" /LENGTH=233 /DNA_ID=CAMNT_0041893371 /DNA_START=154 /DNA_END=855 /DNA_ORIENTATION=-